MSTDNKIESAYQQGKAAALMLASHAIKETSFAERFLFAQWLRDQVDTIVAPDAPSRECVACRGTGRRTSITVAELVSRLDLDVTRDFQGMTDVELGKMAQLLEHAVALGEEHARGASSPQDLLVALLQAADEVRWWKPVGGHSGPAHDQNNCDACCRLKTAIFNARKATGDMP